jgi:hypothetical protein
MPREPALFVSANHTRKGLISHWAKRVLLGGGTSVQDLEQKAQQVM